jgi:hypothetical protein
MRFIFQLLKCKTHFWHFKKSLTSITNLRLGYVGFLLNWKKGFYQVIEP